MKDSILNVPVSWYPNYSGLAVERNLLAYLFDHSLKDKVLAIRSKGTKEERDILKAKLPGITPSAICQPTRSDANVIAHTGLICFDIDKLPAEKMAKLFNIIIKMPFVAYCALSVSGTGYWGLIPVSNKQKHMQHFDAMELYFKEAGIERPYFDTGVKDVSRFRYYSFHEGAYFNHQAEVFNFLYEPPVAPKKLYVPGAGKAAEENPFDDFNMNGEIEDMLVAHGWTYQPAQSKGTRNRYSRPGKTTGISADYCSERKILYVFSSDPATGMPEPAKGYNHVQVFCTLECGGDWKVCAQKLKQMGYGRSQ